MPLKLVAREAELRRAGVRAVVERHGKAVALSRFIDGVVVRIAVLTVGDGREEDLDDLGMLSDAVNVMGSVLRSVADDMNGSPQACIRFEPVLDLVVVVSGPSAEANLCAPSTADT